MWQQIEIEGKRVKFKSEWVAGQLWIYFNGQTFCLPNETVSAGRKSSNTKSADRILAPMPGKITKVLTQEGASVKTGESLVVMEAMKMEYTLKAEAAGVVKAVNVSAGQQVTLGAALVTLVLENEKVDQHSTQKAD